mgnify:CR=1 FL=1
MVIGALPFTPPQAVRELLVSLPSKRMRQVLERRFGLKNGRGETLEEIGKSYKITRERVRQIEADAMRRLRTMAAGALEDFFRPVTQELQTRGGAAAQQELFYLFAPKRWHPHLRLLLSSAPQFYFFAESDECHPYWALDRSAAAGTQAALKEIMGRLDERGKPVDKTALYQLMSLEQRNESVADAYALADSYLGISKLIAANPYGEYGLAIWPSISPRGIKDKAYVALSKQGKPMHFRDIAIAIDQAGWGKKRAHAQTVHNELIKDSHFVLIGRGMYALDEWGYLPGTVRDVLASVLQESAAPLARDEIIRLMSEKRIVKPQTILLNLQDRSRFKKLEDGRYTLA